MSKILKGKFLWVATFVILILGMVWTIPANSAENLRLIPFQGRLTDAEGAALNGVYRITFAIYDAPTGGGAEWTETHQTVSVINGQLNVLLGSMTELDDPDGNGDTSDAVLFDASSGPRFLGIKVGEDTNQEMIPRQQLVPAFHARTADHAKEADHALEADNADTLDGHDSSYFLSQLAAGNSESDGIMFPRDPGGGSGDAAWIRYYPRSGENTTFEIGTSNDAQDHIALMAAGNVGIGTTSPAQKLHVVGNIQVDGAIIAPEGTLRDDGGGWIRTYGGTGWYNQTYGGGWFMTDAAWIRSYGDKSIYHNAGVMRTDGIFEVGPGGDRFRVDGSGKVGIGTTNPGAILNICNINAAISTFRIGNTLHGGLEFTQGSGDLYLGGDNAQAGNFYIKDAQGNIRIGINSDAGSFFDSDLSVTGTFAATHKYFDIQDPRYNDEKRRLIHSTLEGPENAVFYRGKAKLVNRTVTIELPSYFEALTRKEGKTVLLTARNGWSPLYVDGEVEDGRFVVQTTDQGNPGQEFYWEVKAVRADVKPLEVQVIRPE